MWLEIVARLRSRIFASVSFEVFAAGEMGYGLGDVAFEAVGGGDGSHLGEGQGGTAG